MTLRLETPRLILRPFEERDTRPFSHYRSDPEIARYQGWSAPYSIQQAEDFIEEMKTAQPGLVGQWYQLALQPKTGGELLGDCGFVIPYDAPKQAEIGFTLAREYHGQGFASEAVARLLDYLFVDLKLHRVRANCDPANLPSARLMQRLGMRHEGRFVESLWFKGSWATEDWYAILEREWFEK